MLRTREIIPPLTLHALDGRTVRAWDFKQKKNLIILFLDAGCVLCEDYLRRIAADAAAWKENGAVVLVALLGSPSRAVTDFLPDNIIVGLDPSGRAANAYLGRDTLAPAGDARLGVFVTDRYGELIAQWEIGTNHEFPSPGSLRAHLERIEMSCDECSTPLWRVDEG
ncbi:MAG TPA: redoxin domain-containing protein [Candidatus Acidoferrales bacterium]